MDRRNGWFAVSRKLYDGTDPIFGDEPFSKRDAWLDCIRAAAFQPHARTVNGTEVRLERGQFVASTRYLTDRWGWSIGKTSRFLQKLKEHDRIVPVRKIQNVGTVYWIPKYDEYQPSPDSGTPTGTPGGTPERNTPEPPSSSNREPETDDGAEHPNGTPTGTPSGTKEKKGRKKKGSREVQPTARAKDVLREMHEVWHEELGIEGHRIKFTEKRQTKYRRLYEEHLQQLDRPVMAWRAILKCVQASDHHMSRRNYQMPESILRNPERREQWFMEALEAVRTGTLDAEERKRRHRRDSRKSRMEELRR